MLHRKPLLRIALGVVFFFLLAIPSQAAPEGVSLDFEDADIHSLIKYVSEATGHNFIVDPAVKGKVTVYSPVKVSPEEAFQIFVDILRVQGFAVQKSGSGWKILPIKEGISQENGASGNQETVATRIIQLKAGSASELAKTLPPMLGKDYALSAYAPSNTLAITAPKSNLNRALSFVDQVENSKTQGRSVTLPLRHGDAKSMATSLSKVLKSRDEENAKKGRVSMSLVAPDERTNSLLIYGDDTSIDMAKQAISALDVVTPKGKGDVHLIQLSNARAEDLAAVINSLVERQVAGSGNEEKSPDFVLSKDIKVVADKATNSLLITARPDEFDALRNVVEKLDIVRKQVFIEAAIMEVSATASFSFGVNWTAAGKTSQDSIGVGGVNLNGGTIDLGSNRMVSLPSGASLATIFTDAFRIGGTSYNIQSILNAVKGNSDINVLSTPQLLTLDNEEASVEVVDNIPYVKETTTRNDADFTTQAMDYKDVGVKLKVTPRISADGSLRLEVEQEISRVTNGVITLSNGNQLVAPTTRKRVIKSTILLQDTQTAVIGGLLDDQNTYNQSAVPGLGDIPVLGWLFKSRNKEFTRTNLFVFLTPRIIRSPEESQQVTGERQIAVQQTSVGKDGLGLPVMSHPKLLKPVFVN